MKKILIPLLATAAIAAAAPAAAQAWMSINQRQAQLDQRIDVGVRNGTLTAAEAARLRGEFNSLARLEANYRASGGGLNAWERNDLDARFDRLSAQIRYERADNDRYGRGGAQWININQRQAALNRRIDQGIRRGEITRTEAIRLRAEFNGIARLEASYRRSGGGLNAWERRDLDARFDRLALRIRLERSDWDRTLYRGYRR